MDENRSIVMHIGAHKTASSMLQGALKQDEKKLHQHGLAVVHRSELIDSEFHRALKRIVTMGRLPGGPGTQKAAESLKHLIDRPEPRVLLTNEDFFEIFRTPLFYKNFTKALRWVNSLVPERMKIVLFTRNQPDYIESMYMQRVHLGDAVEFASVSSKYLDLDLSWTRVLDAAAKELGRESVAAIPYEAVKRVGSTEYYRALLTACDIDATDYEVSEVQATSRVANRSYSAEAMRLALVINPLLEAKNRIVLRKFLQENYSTATHPRAVLFEESDREELFSRLRADNERLFEVYLSDWQDEAPSYGVTARS